MSTLSLSPLFMVVRYSWFKIEHSTLHSSLTKLLFLSLAVSIYWWYQKPHWRIYLHTKCQLLWSLVRLLSLQWYRLSQESWPQEDDDMLTKMTPQFVPSQEPSVLVKFSGTGTDRYGRFNIADGIRIANGCVHFHKHYPLVFDQELTNIHQQQLVDSDQDALPHCTRFRRPVWRRGWRWLQDEYPDDMRCYG